MFQVPPFAILVSSISVMPSRKSIRSTEKQERRHTPKRPPMDSPTDFQLIIQDNLIKFMGRRFPEFCILRAACRVSVKASSSTTGDARVASYQAAIDSVAARHYADWPFMVEVLNKWLEMNEDFIRDPLSYTASTSLPTPPSTTEKDRLAISMAPETPALTLALAQIPPTVVGGPSLLFSGEAEVPEHVPDSSPIALTTGTEPSTMDDLPSSLIHRGDIRAPIHKFLPFTWTAAFRFLPSLWNLVVTTLPSVLMLGLSRSKQNRGQY